MHKANFTTFLSNSLGNALAVFNLYLGVRSQLNPRPDGGGEC